MRALRLLGMLLVVWFLFPDAAGAAPIHPIEANVRRAFPGLPLDSDAGFEERAAGFRVRNRQASELRVTYPRSFDDPWVVESGKQRLVLRAVGARRASAVESAGKLIYERPFDGVDVVEIPRGNRSEELLILSDRSAPLVYDFEVVESEGIASAIIRDGAIRFLPRAEDVQKPGAFSRSPQVLQIDRPWVIDAEGRRSETHARWSADNAGTIPKTVRLTVNPGRLSFPLVVDPSFTTTGALLQSRWLHTATLLTNGTILIVGGYVAGTPSQSAELYDPATGDNTPIASLTAHAGHTATLLPSGQVLIAGGGSNAVETYDSITGQFAAMTPLAASRTRHTATLLPDGVVLFAGGESGGTALSSLELYSPGGVGSTSVLPGILSSPKYDHTATLLSPLGVLIAGGTADGSNGTATANYFEIATSSVMSLPGLVNARFQHTATALGDGRVLLAGGNSASGALASTEVFSDLNGTSVLGTPLSAARFRHSATLLPSGKVLISGGQPGTVITAELYDPGPGTFSPIDQPSVSEHTATLLPSGRVLMAGGRDNAGNATAGLEVYDATNGGAFTSASGLVAGRRNHTATPLANGTVLLAGGLNGLIANASAELYDSTRGVFLSTGVMFTARSSHTATLLRSGKVLITGGLSNAGTALPSCELYDPAQGTFSRTGSMAAARAHHTATLLWNGKVLVAGGDGLASGELYDPATGTFQLIGSMAAPRSRHTATLLRDGRVLVAGGFDGSGYLASAEVFEPLTRAFYMTGGPLLTARGSHTATLLSNGQVLVAGGAGVFASQLDSIELYDPGLSTFMPGANLSVARYNATATALPNGRILIAGGAAGSSVLTSAELIDPLLMVVLPAGSMSGARSAHTATLLPSGGVLFTGGDTTSFRTVELYDTGDGFMTSRRPVLLTVPSALNTPSTMTLAGTGFRGDSEAGSGSTQNSATNYPVLQLQRVDNDQIVFPGAGTPFSDTIFASNALANLPGGAYRTTLITNGGPSQQGFAFIGPATPSITSVQPAFGSPAGGQLVTITGTDLSNATVTIGGIVVGASATETQIQFSTPAHAAGVVEVAVETPLGGSATPSGEFTYVLPATVTSLSPTAGPSGGSQLVTITGTNLARSTSVRIGAFPPVPVSSATDTAVTFLTAAVFGQSGVPLNVYVNDGTDTYAGTYTYLDPPSLSTMASTEGPVTGGQTVIITGSNLKDASVSIGGAAAVVDSASQSDIFLKTPPHAAGIYQVVISTPGGSALFPTSYTYRAAPVISYAAPSMVTGGDIASLFGSNFLNASMTVDGLLAYVYPSSTAGQINYLVPAHASGTVTLVVTTPGGSATIAVEYVAQPTVAVNGMSPTVGPTSGGQWVTIVGSGLATINSVTVGGGPPQVPAVTDTSVSFSTPPAAGAGPAAVVISSLLGTSRTAGMYTYVDPPAVLAISPNAGPIAGNQALGISGSNLGGATVTIGGAVATINSNSSTSIVLTTPAHAAGTFGVVVTTPGGSSNAGLYSYVLPPVITNVTPNTGSLAGSQTVAIIGQNLAGTTVTVDGIAALVFASDATAITFAAPAHAPGSAAVTVTTPGGSATTSYTYVGPPVITGLQPLRGPYFGGTVVTLTGTNLSNASVEFGSGTVGVTNNTAGSLTFTTLPAPPGSQWAIVYVTTPGGTATTAFGYLDPPTVFQISPMEGPVSGGQGVTIFGAFLESAQVTIDGVPVSSISSFDQVRFTTPAHAAGGAVVLVTTTAGAAAAPFYAYVAAPVIFTVTPNAGPIAGGQQVRITGSGLSGFTYTSTVQFGASPPVPATPGAGFIDVITPAAATPGRVDMTVYSMGGVTVAPQAYTYLAQPTITSIEPGSGPIAGGQTVVITGTNLTDAAVTMGGTAASVVSTTPTSITLTTPPHIGGPVSVTVTTAGGQTTATSAYTFLGLPGAGALPSLTVARYHHTATALSDGTVLVVGGLGPSSSLASSELYDTAGAAIATTGALGSARYGHTATLLLNGKVLVTGGYGASTPLASAEIYDPVTHTFAGTGGLTAPRYFATATLLANGKVLIVGGEDSAGALASAELYDPATATFTAAGSLATARYGHTATLLPSGNVLLAGGYGLSGQLSSAEIYIAATGAFTPAASMLVARNNHTATLLANGKVLIAGGYGGAAALSSAEVFDPAAGTFASAGALVTARQAHNATLLPSGKVLILGGQGTSAALPSLELFDPVNNSFSAVVSLSTARHDATATLLATAKVLIAGGYGVAPLTSMELYDPSNGSFAVTGSLPASRGSATATLLPSGRVLIAGGSTGSTEIASAEVYDPANGTFAVSGTMSAARRLHTATLLLNGKVLVTGGRNGSGGLSSAEIYDPPSGTFASGEPMSAVRFGHSATLLANGLVLIAGGESTSGFLASAELYDPVTSTFRPTGSLTAARGYHAATLLPDGRVLIAGGASGSSLDSAELYDPASGTFAPTTANMLAPRSSFTATLLMSGKVLIAGGNLVSAELYDPATGIFSATGSMANPRAGQTATLLPNGQMLIAGGASTETELYDPARGAFVVTQSMIGARSSHTATLLLNGKVLLAGGAGVSSTELYDPGDGYASTRRPLLVTAAVVLNQPASLVLSGSGFRGDSEASSGASNASSSNAPVLQLQRLDNEQTLFVSAGSPWSETSFTSMPLAGLPSGHYRMTIIADGIPSLQRLIVITTPPRVTSINPSSGPIGGGQSVTIAGTSLKAASITIGGNAAAVTASSATSVTFTTPPHVAGVVGVVVTTPGGTTTSVGGYTYVIPAPATITATAGTSTSVAISWAAVAAAASYEVARTADRTTFVSVGTATGTSFTDPSAEANTAYLYKVRAFDASSTAGPYSASDLATTVIYSDDAVDAGVTIVRAAHIMELRRAVNAVRALAGLTASQFTDTTITAGVTTMKAAHLNELRASLDAARAPLSLAPAAYTDVTIAPLSTTMKAAHVQELRNAMK